MYNNEAELAILGSMIKDSECAERATELSEELFFIEDNKTLFKQIKQLVAQNKQVDVVSLANHYDELNVQIIKQIADRVITTTKFNHYLDILKEFKYRRDLIKASDHIKQYANEMDMSLNELVVKSEQSVIDIDKNDSSTICKPVDFAVAGLNELEERYKSKGKMPGLSTGFYDYNKITLGLRKKFLYIFGGRPSIGKTAFATAVMRDIAIRQQKNVLFFSLEMPKESIYDRLVAMMTRIPSDKISLGNLNEDEWAKVGKATAEISSSKLFVEDTKSQYATDLMAKARRLKKKEGLDLVIIDHLTEIKRDSKQQVRIAVGDNVRMCKRIAHELDVPVILLAQLNRDVTNRDDKRPTLADLRETGEIEEIADVISFIHREGYYDENADQYIGELITRKNRNGRLGTVQLKWTPAYARYDNLERGF